VPEEAVVVDDIHTPLHNNIPASFVENINVGVLIDVVTIPVYILGAIISTVYVCCPVVICPALSCIHA
jgi:hypothetical protein